MAENKTNGDVPHPVAEMVMSGLTVLRAENDSQQAMAIARPRNEKMVLELALQELDLAPQFAEEAWYSIPYKDRAEGGERTVNVEGPSIKAAMAIGRRWGNSANAARVIDQSDERIIVEGVFLDYETNTRTLRTVTVPKLRWDRYARAMVPLREDRLNMAILAGMSKAVRNAILASLPVFLVESYVAHAKALASNSIKPKDAKKELTPKEKVAYMVEQFVKLGTTKPLVDAYCAGQAFEEDDALALHLKGLYTAIKDGQAKLEEVFGVPPKETVTPPAERSVPAAGDLLGGAGAGTAPAKK